MTQSLTEFKDLTVGEATATTVPGVLELAVDADVEERVDEIGNIPGVIGVDIVFSDFSDVHDATGAQ